MAASSLVVASSPSAASSFVVESLPWMVATFVVADSGVEASFAVADSGVEASVGRSVVDELRRRTVAFASDPSESGSHVGSSASVGPSSSPATCRSGAAATTGVLAAAVGAPLPMSGRTAPSSGSG